MAEDNRNRAAYLRLMYEGLDSKVNSYAGNINAVGDTSFDTAQLQMLRTNQAFDQAKRDVTSSEQRPQDQANWWERTTQTISALRDNLITGFLGFFDGFYDWGNQALAGMGIISQEQADANANFDWQAYVTKYSQTMWSSPYAMFDPRVYSELGELWNDMQSGDTTRARAAADYTQQMSWASDWGDVGQFIRGVEQSIGQMLPSIIVGAGMPAGSIAQQAAALGTEGVGVFARSASENYAEHGDWGKANLQGLLSGAVETISEIVVGPMLSKATGMTSHVGGVFAQSIGKKSAEAVGKAIPTSFIKQMGHTFLEEGLEEVFSGVFDPLISSIGDNGQSLSKYGDKDFWLGTNLDSILMQGLAGGVAGVVMGAPTTAMSIKQYSAYGEPTMQAREDFMKAREEYLADRTNQEKADKLAEASMTYAAYLKALNENATPEQIRNVTAGFTSAQAYLNQNVNATLTDYAEQFAKDTESEKIKAGDMDAILERDALRDWVGDANGEINILKANDERLKNSNGGFDNANISFNEDGTLKALNISESLMESGDFAAVLGHEIGIHLLLENASKADLGKYYNRIKNTGFWNDAPKGWDYNGKQFYDEYLKRYEAEGKADAEAKAKGEVVAKYFEAMLRSENESKTFSKLNDLLMKESFFNTVKNALARRSFNMDRRITAQLAKDIRKAADAYDDAMAKRYARVYDKIVVEGKDENQLTAAERAVYRELQGALASIKNENSTVDNEGNALSEAQQKFFKDSVVRDENGNLRIMYHGTYEPGFTVFDKERSQGAFFFTDDELNAASYGGLVIKDNIYKVYLNVTNPYVVDAKNSSWNKLDFGKTKKEGIVTFKTFKKLSKEGKIKPSLKLYLSLGSVADPFYTEDQAYEELFYTMEKSGKSMEEVIDDWFTGKGASYDNTIDYFFNYIKENYEDLGYNVDDEPVSLGEDLEYAENVYDVPDYESTRTVVQKVLKMNEDGANYDGIIFKNIIDFGDSTIRQMIKPNNVVVAFEPNQIKSIDNKNPTENEDIRYSIGNKKPKEVKTEAKTTKEEKAKTAKKEETPKEPAKKFGDRVVFYHAKTKKGASESEQQVRLIMEGEDIVKVKKKILAEKGVIDATYDSKKRIVDLHSARAIKNGKGHYISDARTEISAFKKQQAIEAKKAAAAAKPTFVPPSPSKVDGINVTYGKRAGHSGKNVSEQALNEVKDNIAPYTDGAKLKGVKVLKAEKEEKQPAKPTRIRSTFATDFVLVDENGTINEKLLDAMVGIKSGTKEIRKHKGTVTYLFQKGDVFHIVDFTPTSKAIKDDAEAKAQAKRAAAEAKKLASKKAKAPKEVTDWHVGDKIKHPTLGVGEVTTTIIESTDIETGEKTTRDDILVVKFKDGKTRMFPKATATFERTFVNKKGGEGEAKVIAKPATEETLTISKSGEELIRKKIKSETRKLEKKLSSEFGRHFDEKVDGQIVLPITKDEYNALKRDAIEGDTLKESYKIKAKVDGWDAKIVRKFHADEPIEYEIKLTHEDYIDSKNYEERKEALEDAFNEYDGKETPKREKPKKETVEEKAETKTETKKESVKEEKVEAKPVEEKAEEKKAEAKKATEKKEAKAKEETAKTPEQIAAEEKKRWTRGIKTSDPLKAVEKNMADAIKDAADTRLDPDAEVFAVKDAIDALKELENYISAATGTTYNIPEASTKARRLFEDLNVLPAEKRQAIAEKFVRSIVEDNRSSGGTLFDEFAKSKSMTIAEYNAKKEALVEEYTSQLLKSISLSGRETKVNKLVAELLLRVRSYRQASKLDRALRTAMNAISKEVFKSGNTGQYHISESKHSIVDSFLKIFRHKVNYSYYSNSNIEAFKNFNMEGLIEYLAKDALDLDTDFVTTNASGDVVNGRDLIIELSNELKASYDPNATTMTAEQVETAATIVNLVKKLYMEAKGSEMVKAKAQAKIIQDRIAEVNKRRKFSKTKIGRWFTRLVLDYTSPDVFFSYLFGGRDNEAYKLVWDELMVKPYYAQLTKQRQYYTEFDALAKVIAKHGYDRIEVKTENGQTIKIEKNALYSFALNQMSPDNNVRLSNPKTKISYTEKGFAKVTHELSYATLDEAVKQNVTEEEMNELKAIFDWYNGSMQKYTKSVMEKNIGFSSLREGYYPIVASEAHRNTNFTEGDALGGVNANALMNNRMKGLTNRLTNIEINVNPLFLGHNYIDKMTTSGEIGKESVLYNRLFRIKNEGKSAIVLASNGMVPNAKDYIGYAFNALIGNRQMTAPDSSFIAKLASRFATVQLGLNIRSSFKQTCSLFTAVQQVGMKAWFRGLMRNTGFKNFFSKARKNAIASENPVFWNRTYNAGFSRAITLASPGQFTHGVSKKIADFSMKFVEGMDRFVCYTTYGMAEEYAKLQNLTEGSKEYKKLVNETFSQIIMNTQSNSDRIMMSRTRSGALGNIVKVLFGTFQSDAQNKASLCAKAILDYQSAKADGNDALLTKSKKSIGVFAAGVIASGLLAMLIDRLVDLIHDKKEWQELGITGDNWQNVLFEGFENTTLQWIPFVGTISDWFQYGSVSYLPLEPLDNLAEVASGFFDGQPVSKAKMMKFIKAATDVFGLPATNFEKLVNSVLQDIPGAKLQFRNLLYGVSEGYLANEVSNRIAKRNYDRAGEANALLYSLYKAPVSDAFAREVVRLKTAGASPSTRNIPSAIGDTTLTDEQKAAFKEAYYGLGESASRLMASKFYVGLTDEQKASAITKLSSAYFDYASAKALGKEPSGRLAMLLAEGVSIDEFIAIISSVPKDAKKDDVIKALNAIKGKSGNERILIAWLMGYQPADKSRLRNALVNAGVSAKSAKAATE